MTWKFFTRSFFQQSLCRSDDLHKLETVFIMENELILGEESIDEYLRKLEWNSK